MLRQTEIEIQELDREVGSLQSSLELINKTIEPIICKKCRGFGIERYCDAAGDMDDRECKNCGGTGVKRG